MGAPLVTSMSDWGYHNKGCTILAGVAFLRNLPRAVRLLMEHKADPCLKMKGDGPDIAAIHCAAATGHSENFDAMMELRPGLALADTYDTFNMDPFKISIIFGQNQMLHHILTK